MLHTCKYQILFRGRDAFSCLFMTTFISTQKRREGLGTFIQYNSYTELDALAQDTKSRATTAPPSPCWISHIPRRLGHWQKLTTAWDRKQLFHHTLPIKQQCGGTVKEKDGRGQQHNQAPYKDISNRKLLALALSTVHMVPKCHPLQSLGLHIPGSKTIAYCILLRVLKEKKTSV